MGISLSGVGKVSGFVFIGSDSNIFGGVDPDRVTHPLGYVGTGGVLNISVGIDPGSPNAASMVIPTKNVIQVFNGLAATTGNLGSLGTTQVDFESVLLHEMGHSLGLGHVNLASESGLVEPNRNFTKALVGVDGVLGLDDGVDNIIGSADDVRGDDVNLNWFKITDNDPFGVTLPGTIDSTTYSRDLGDLPGGDLFSANGDRQVGGALGYVDTEVVMQQGTFSDETQRTLGADDVAGIRYGMSGLDEIQGTADDYTINLSFAGFDAGADIVIDFDNVADFAASGSSLGQFIDTPTHLVIASTSISFNTGYDWYFNADLIPEPGRALLGLIGLFGVFLRRRR
ncbi:MAG: hypothetical protein P8J87_21660 [Verrucomicrobiales bacterium]|nr:hypothetical protein [Verrucomicrobiales bacterium]